MSRKTAFSYFCVSAFMILLLPVAAFAIDMEFVTYGGGYDAIVATLKSVAHVYDNNNYKSLFFTVAVAGIFFAGAGYYFKSVMGVNAGSPYSWLIPCMLGLAIYVATIIPKGNLIVSDESACRFETVPGIPDILVLFAGVFNKLEIGIIDIIATASIGVDDYRQHGSGRSYKGLANVSSMPLSAVDTFIDQSVDSYIADCVYPALVDPTSGITVETLRHTSTAKDKLALAVNPAIFTKVFTSANPEGTTTSCSAAWTHINTALTPAAVSDNALKTACASVGYDIGNNCLFAECKSIMTQVLQDPRMGGMASITLEGFLMQRYLALRIAGLYDDSSGASTALFNYGNTYKAGASSEIMADESLPKMRAALVAIALALVPFIGLMMPTPLFAKGLLLTLGLFVWLTLWGIIDALIYSLVRDTAAEHYVGLSVVRVGSGPNELGMDGLAFFPDINTKIVNELKKLRVYGAMLSTVITGVLVKFGGSAMAHLAGGMSGAASSDSHTAAGVGGADPLQKASMSNQSISALGTQAWANMPLSTRVSGEAGRMVEATGQMAARVATAGSLPAFGAVAATSGVQAQRKTQGDNRNYSEGDGIAIDSLGFTPHQAEQLRSRAGLSSSAYRDMMKSMQALTQIKGSEYSGLSGTPLFDKIQNESAVMSASGSLKSTMETGGGTMTQTTTADGKGGAIMTIGNNAQSYQFATMDGKFVLTGIGGTSVGAGFGSADKETLTTARKTAEQETDAAGVAYGNTLLHGLTNSTTATNAASAANEIRTGETGTTTLREQFDKRIQQALKDSVGVKTTSGRTTGQEAWGGAGAKLGGGLEVPGDDKTFVGPPAPGKAPAKGGGYKVAGDVNAGYRITAKTQDGTEYSVGLTSEESKSLARDLAKITQDAEERSKGTKVGRDNQTAIARLKQVTGTQATSENYTEQKQRLKAIEASLSGSTEQSVGARADLNKALYTHTAREFFGDASPRNVVEAGQYLERLAAEGRTAEIAGIIDNFLSGNGIKPQVDGEKADGLRNMEIQGTPEHGDARGKHDQGQQRIQRERAKIPNATGAGSLEAADKKIKEFTTSTNTPDLLNGKKGEHSEMTQTQTEFALTNNDLNNAYGNWKHVKGDAGALFNAPGAQITTADQLKTGIGPNDLHSFFTFGDPQLRYQKAVQAGKVKPGSFGPVMQRKKEPIYDGKQ